VVEARGGDVVRIGLKQARRPVRAFVVCPFIPLKTSWSLPDFRFAGCFPYIVWKNLRLDSAAHGNRSNQSYRPAICAHGSCLRSWEENAPQAT